MAAVRIVHLSAHDLEGGAARAAFRLHRGLRSVGEESVLVALYKTSSDPSVVCFEPPRNLLTKLRRAFKRRYLERSGSRIRCRPAGSSLFSDDRSQHNADVLKSLPQADILNLHWIAGAFDYQLFFRAIPERMQVVWTLHDMNPFTGGCHFDDGCGKFSQSCGACPQLSSFDAGDLSAKTWMRKEKAFSSAGSSRLRFVAPSRWLASEAEKSSLLSGHTVSVIPYGLDTEHFQPRDRWLAREKLEIPREAKTILFVADTAAEKRKGFHVLVEALGAIEDPANIYFLVIGKGIPKQVSSSRSKVVEFIGDEASLSYVYSAADVFVVPSLQDNLPNTAIEALACGVPTIGSNTGGIREIVRDGQTGVLVPAGEPRALRGAVVGLLQNPARLLDMSAECRRTAIREYALEVQATRYRALYSDMLCLN